jgi:putative glutamine amidotransferase
MMKKQTVIALTMRVTFAKNYYEPRLSISFDWMDYILHLGGLPFLIPTKTEVCEQCFNSSNADILFLTGGDDIQLLKPEHPSSFSSVESCRDVSEYKLIELAIKKKIPVVGICRGFQILNLYFGGTLTDLRSQSYDHKIGDHPVQIINDKIGERLGGNEITTNSYHRTGILEKDIASDFEVGGFSDKDIVEVAFHKTLPIIGLQWHPERDENYVSQTTDLLKHFITNRGL